MFSAKSSPSRKSVNIEAGQRHSQIYTGTSRGGAMASSDNGQCKPSKATNVIKMIELTLAAATQYLVIEYGTE